jgi:hypothetical protein
MKTLSVNHTGGTIMNQKEAYSDRINRITRLATKQKEEQESRLDYLQRTIRNAMDNAMQSIPEDYRDTEASVKNILSIRKEYKEKLEKIPRTPTDGGFRTDRQNGTRIYFRTDLEDEAWNEVEFYPDHFSARTQNLDGRNVQANISYGQHDVSCVFVERSTEAPDKNSTNLLAKAASDGIKRLAVFEQLFNIGIDMDLGRYTEEFYPYKYTAFLFPSKLRNGYIPEPEAVPFFLDTAETLSKEHVAGILSMTMKKDVDPCEISRIDTPERVLQAYEKEPQKGPGSFKDSSPDIDAETFGVLTLRTIRAYMKQNGHSSGVDCQAEFQLRDGQPYIILEDESGAKKEEHIQALFEDYLSADKNFRQSVADAALFALFDCYGEEFPSDTICECADAVIDAWDSFGIAEPEQEEDEEPDR